MTKRLIGAAIAIKINILSFAKKLKSFPEYWHHFKLEHTLLPLYKMGINFCDLCLTELL